MDSTISHTKRIFQRVLDIPFLKENNLSVNILLLLGLLAFVVITIDLDTELSVQKDEITQVVCVLDESIGTLQLDALDIITIDPPVVGYISPINYSNSDNDVLTLPSDRAPPSLA
jgi:hypothetical protein